MIPIKGKKILLLGLGLHGGGVATARWLHKKGAKLIVSDLRDKKKLAPSIKILAKHKGVRYVLGKHQERDVRWADFIVYNPGVPKQSKYLQLARRLDKQVYNEASLFFDRCKAPIVAVTGTRGKSTTASLIAEMYALKNPLTVLAGNIKTAFMMDVLERVTESHIVVLELSSWQLEGLNIVRKAPHVAVVTNLYPDHLNRYRNITHYYNSKKEIFKHQTENHALILNYDDPILREWHKEALSSAVYFTKKNLPKLGAFMLQKKIYFGTASSASKVVSTKDIKLEGAHNLENSLAAITAAKLYGVTSTSIKKVLKSPPVLFGRQEIVLSKNGISYVNDTTATTPEAGIAALERFGGRTRKIILIAGGADKKLVFKEWARFVKKYCKQVYLLKGDASEKQKKALKGSKVDSGYSDLGVLVKKASQNASKGDIILFSPAAASFTMWSHEFERGDDFVKAVKNV